MYRRSLSVLAIGLFVLALFAPAPGTSASDDSLDHRVVGVSADALTAAGYDVIDDYGAFATARLTGTELGKLRADGAIVTLLDHANGRGGWRIDVTQSDAVMPSDLTVAATDYAIVQFRGPVKAEWYAAMAAEVDAIYDYLPANGFLVRASAPARAQLASLDQVRAVEAYHPGFKLAPELAGTGIVQATALAYRDAPLAAVVRDMESAGVTVGAYATTTLEHVIDFAAPASKLDDVARIEAVSWIEPAYDEGSSDNAEASAITQSGNIGVWTLDAQGVDGSSQVTSVCDTGTNTGQVLPVNLPATPAGVSVMTMTHEMHDDNDGNDFVFYNKHLLATPLPPQIDDHHKMALYYSPQEGGANKGDSDDADGHGTHTSGTLAGDKPPYGVRDGNDGVAYAAKLMVCDITTGGTFNILNDYSNYWNPAYDGGARVNSNSWGSSHTNTYTEKARQHDSYVWDHRDFLILRSMGNTGLGSIRPEAVAKSAMGIGSTTNGLGMETLSSFSTGGLTQDGRTKPNVVAPGECLDSSYLSGATSYSCLSGTSMSTPTTAGAATLVRDYFAKGFYPSGAADPNATMNPSSALVRGVLQVSGKEITSDRGEPNFPNKAQGWGRVTLDSALYFAGDASDLFVADEGAGVATGQAESIAVDVIAGTPLRIMVAWSDQAGAAGANPAIVNDLDVTVTGPGGMYVGNHFVGNQVPAGAFAADTRNVEEAVYINAPAAGTYTITVTGSNVPSGPQPYAVVVTGDFA